jgi:beta-mannosidase
MKQTEVTRPKIYPVMPNSIFSPLLEAKEAQPIPTSGHPRGRKHRHKEVLLNGTWKFRPDPEEEGEKEGWYLPEVSDAGWGEIEIPSNFVDRPELQNFYKPVWFRTVFKKPEGQEIKLLFEGVDYFAHVWLNGEKLGEHEGYFCPFQFRITNKLRDENVLVVKVLNPFDPGIRGRGFLTTFLSTKHYPKGVLNFHDCRPGDNLNPKLAQSLGTGGIYRPVKLRVSGKVHFDWIFLTPVLSGKKAKILIDVFLSNEGSSAEEVELVLELREIKEIRTYKVVAEPGCNRVELEWEMQNPKLWFPWDHPELGGPNLYTLHSRILKKDECWDEREDKFGIREVKLGGELDEKGDKRTGTEAYHWFINGKKIFIKGTNYLSTEWMSKVSRELYEKDASLIKEANMNMVRVHAHLEPPLLYDVFDEQGIMIWQDFTLQWGYRNDREFREKCKKMLAEMIYLHYNHPSIVLWCCHNEPLWVWFKIGNKGLDDELFQVATSIDSTRPIHKASGKGDSHIYLGWYGGLFTDVRKRKDPFPTEFGSQAISLNFKRWIEDAWPPKIKKWRYHDAQLSILCTYLGNWRKYNSFDEFALASQLYQAELLKYYIEQFRIKKYRPTGGCLSFWLLNWWPSIGWGVVDHERNPMLGYEAIKKVYLPLLVCVDWERSIFKTGEEVRLPVWVVNDYHTKQSGCAVKWSLIKTKNRLIEGSRKWMFAELHIPWINFPVFSVPRTVCPGEEGGEPLSEGSFEVKEIEPDSVQKVGEITFKFPEPLDLRLELALIKGRKVLTSNRYHFLVR